MGGKWLQSSGQGQYMNGECVSWLRKCLLAGCQDSAEQLSYLHVLHLN